MKKPVRPGQQDQARNANADIPSVSPPFDMAGTFLVVPKIAFSAGLGVCLAETP